MMDITGIVGTIANVVVQSLKPDSDKEMLRNERRYMALCRIEKMAKSDRRDHHVISQLETLYPMAEIKGLPFHMAERFHEYVSLTGRGLDHPEAKAYLKCGRMQLLTDNEFSPNRRKIASARRSLFGGWIALCFIMVIFVWGYLWGLSHASTADIPAFFFPLLSVVILLLIVAYYHGSRQEHRTYHDAELFWEHFGPWLKEKKHQEQRSQTTVSLSAKMAIGGVIAAGAWLVGCKWKT